MKPKDLSRLWRVYSSASHALREWADQQNSESALIAKLDADYAEVSARQQAASSESELGQYLTDKITALVILGEECAGPVEEQPTLPKDVWRIAVRALLDLLSERAPGRSVEVRVPPYAAVQCVKGPRHTRGTPPNVIEMDAATWVRLATGKSTWANELDAGNVVASGDRADLRPWLPLVE